MTTPILTNAHHAAQYIKHLAPSAKPVIGIVLGSGLGSFVQQIKNALVIPYSQLKGFPIPTVHGHEGNLVLGEINGQTVVCLQGRAHAYEGSESHEAVKTYVRTLRLLGCEYFLATNASGSLQPTVPPGELMLITDHINLQATNPLTGPNDEAFGPRFLPVDNAYDSELRTRMLSIATEAAITLHQGVYVAVSGPNYETAAEIKAFQRLGGDAVGMSTVPEVLVANHCGMKVLVIASITNFATGLTTISHNHNEVVTTAAKAADKLSELIGKFIGTL